MLNHYAIVYDIPVRLTGAGLTPPWTVRTGRVDYDVIALTQPIPDSNQVRIQRAVTGVAAPDGEVARYAPPPSRVDSLLGVPAGTQLAIPIIPLP